MRPAATIAGPDRIERAVTRPAEGMAFEGDAVVRLFADGVADAEPCTRGRVNNIDAVTALRHTAAARLLRAGADLKRIAAVTEESRARRATSA